MFDGRGDGERVKQRLNLFGDAMGDGERVKQCRHYLVMGWVMVRG